MNRTTGNSYQDNNFPLSITSPTQFDCEKAEFLSIPHGFHFQQQNTDNFCAFSGQLDNRNPDNNSDQPAYKDDSKNLPGQSKPPSYYHFFPLTNQGSLTSNWTTNFNGNHKQHNQEEGIHNTIEFTTKPINCFRNQLIFIPGEREGVSQQGIFKKNRFTFMSPRFTDDYFMRIITGLLLKKNKVASYFERERDFSAFNAILVDQFPNLDMQIYKSDVLLTDITSYKQMLNLIINEHQISHQWNCKFDSHTIMDRFYKPNIESLIKRIVFDCKICSS